MATNPNVTFGEPRQVVTSYARIELNEGIVHISVTGEPAAVQTYIKEARIYVELRPGEEFSEITSTTPEQQDKPTFPDDEGALRIIFDVVASQYNPFTLHLDIDPVTIPEKKQHLYEVSSCSAVRVGIAKQGNDTDCYLRIWDGSQWAGRKSGTEGEMPWPLDQLGSQIKVQDWLTDATLGQLSKWQLSVYGQGGSSCSYDLYGTFQGRTYVEA